MTSSESTSLDLLGGWSSVLERIIKGDRLTSWEAAAVLQDVLAGNATSAQLAAFLVVLRSRGETIDEIVGLSSAMLEAAVPMRIAASLRAQLIDTCGTGGDRSGTINVSTMAAFVAAAAGVQVCKHGNRAASSQTGSADVLEALGVVADLGPEGVVQCIDETNIGFCFAPRFHPAMRYVGPIRKELGVGTAFNFLGPLINPARLQRQVIGVSDVSVATLMMGVLQAHGATRAMIVHGHDGLDEITTTTLSTIHELRDGEVRTFTVDPTKFGISLASPQSLKGGAPAENAERVRRILEGETCDQSEIVALNSAAALMVGDAVDSFTDGVELSREILRTGKAAESLDRLIAVSQQTR